MRSTTSESIWMMRPQRRACIPESTHRPRSTGLLTKNSSCARWSCQFTSGSGASGCGPVALRTSTSTTKTIGDRSDKLSDLQLVGDVSREGGGSPARALDRVDHCERLRLVAYAVD